METRTHRIARHLLLALRPDEPSDADLLTRYVERRDAAAFEALVRRHGPMVLGVCRRVLRDPHDADDAFQAAFLVLVRRADAVRPREMVGNFLHGVARQTALKLRSAVAARRLREAPTAEPPEPLAATPPRDDLRELLDTELRGLPEKYRAAILLCDLEGHSHATAARHLGWPQGTLSGRLSRARALLAARLSRRGLTPGAIALTAAVPASLLVSTIRAAATPETASAVVLSLTKGVVQTMLLTKLKRATLALTCVAALVATPAFVLLARGQSGERPTSEPVPATPEKRDAVKEDVPLFQGKFTGWMKGEAIPKNRLKEDVRLLQGTWKCVSLEHDGVRYGEGRPEVAALRLVVSGDSLEMVEKGGSVGMSYEVAPDRSPKMIRMQVLGKARTGLYELDGDTLRLCLDLDPDRAEVPTSLTADYGQKWMLMTYRRDSVKAKPAPLAALALVAPRKVRQVIVTGNKKVPAATILEHFPVYPGQVLDRESLKAAARKLSELEAKKLIRGTTYQLVDLFGGEFVDVVVEVQEADPPSGADELRREIEQLRDQLKKLEDKLDRSQSDHRDAEKLSRSAEFYRYTGHPEAAEFQEETLRRRHPDSPLNSPR